MVMSSLFKSQQTDKLGRIEGMTLLNLFSDIQISIADSFFKSCFNHLRLCRIQQNLGVLSFILQTFRQQCCFNTQLSLNLIILNRYKVCLCRIVVFLLFSIFEAKKSENTIEKVQPYDTFYVSYFRLLLVPLNMIYTKESNVKRYLKRIANTFYIVGARDHPPCLYPSPSVQFRTIRPQINKHVYKNTIATSVTQYKITFTLEF